MEKENAKNPFSIASILTDKDEKGDEAGEKATSESSSPPAPALPRKSPVYPHMYMLPQHHDFINSFYTLPLRYADVYGRSLGLAHPGLHHPGVAPVPTPASRDHKDDDAPNSRQDEDDEMVDVESVTSPCPVTSDNDSHDGMTDRVSPTSTHEHSFSGELLLPRLVILCSVSLSGWGFMCFIQYLLGD